MRFAKKYFDSIEKLIFLEEPNSQSLMNLHNNKAGRLVSSPTATQYFFSGIDIFISRECYCHLKNIKCLSKLLAISLLRQICV